MKIYILFWIFLGVGCREFKTDANAKRCKHIESFHGGDVHYFGEKKRGSSAFYRCKDGYHLSPSNVESSTCTDDFEWDPVPPQCLKMARVQIPKNGYIKGNKDILLHGESYRLTCHNDYEFYSEEYGYIDRRLLQIRNKNGTLEPKVPKCEEKRCDPADQYKAIVKYTNSSSVTAKISSQTKVRLECENGYGYYRGDQPMKTPLARRCVKGKIESAPVCKEASCLVSVFPGNTDTYYRAHQTPYLLVKGHNVTPKNKLEVVCTNEDDFELFANSTASYLESFTTKCRKGRFDVEASEFPICIEKRCHFKPSQDECYTTNEREECILGEFKVPSRTNVTLKCKEGYRLNRSKDGLSEHEHDEVQITCTKGSYFKGYKCIPEDSCKLKINEGSKYHVNGTLIETDGSFPNGTQVDIQCLDDLDIFDEEDNVVNDTNIYPHMTCYQGIWKYMYKCKRRCNTFNVTNEEIINKGKNITTDLDVVHGDNIIVRCGGSQDKDFQMKCDNGEWQGYVNCNDERKKLNANDVSENITQTNMAITTYIVETTTSNGCFLPPDLKFTYWDENDRQISEGSFVGNGKTLTVRCATFDYFDIFTSYDYDDNNITERTVTCIDGELSRFEVDCPDVDPASCMELENGVVKKSFYWYIVSCNEGFSLNLITPDTSECTCQNGELRSTTGNQIPKCIQNNCTLPYDADDKLSVKDKSRVLSLSAGSTVISGDHVYFNCSKVTKSIYEPLDRRFKCVKGRWIEDEMDPKWVFGNDGEFPKCRKAICEPNCTNGGVCYKDDHCRCKHLTKGKRCEIVWCDEQCNENGGKCVTGKCSCPAGRYGPNCEKKSCTLPENSAKPKVLKTMYSIGDTLKNFECGFGYSLSSKDSTTCQEDGSWSNIIQCVKIEPASCMELENGVVKKSFNLYTVSCNEGFSLNLITPDKSECTCQNGELRSTTGNQIPKCIQKVTCKLKINEGSKYYLNGTLIENDGRFPNGTQVDMQCLDDFDTFDEEDNFVNETNIYPHVTCYEGIWKYMYKCKKRCGTFNVTNEESIKKGENITTDLDVVHGDSIIVRCGGSQDKDFQMKCDNGEWQGYVDCNDENKKINSVDVSENITQANMAGKTDIVETTTTTNGCFLPPDLKFIYRDENDRQISEGSFVGIGDTLTVRCATFDYFDFFTSYDYDDNNITKRTVTCIEGELSHFELDCPDVEPASCMELENGVVKKSFNLYTVSCNEGFSLNLITPDKSECSCQNGELRSTTGNQIPKCIQNNCTLPYDADDKLSVKDRSRFLSLSAGSTVISGDHVYFNCSKVTENIYEPLDRRFKCVKGRWIEDEMDSKWVFGNDGEFPKCRKAICEPNCTNGGVCYKDDHCRCKHLTKGKRCEIVWCDEQCNENGGRCVTGKCSCPEGRYGPKCEKKSCTLPENSAKPKGLKTMYRIGDTLKDFECGFGYTLSSKDSMTCQEDGSWSNIIQCVKSVVYLISVKTGNDGSKGWKGSGTDANVYIHLHGRSGKTNKINLKGSFGNNDLDETMVEEKDIRPVTSVTIGHDGRGTGSGWFLEFVSIYVESMNEYYVFSSNDSVWIKKNKDVVLPLKDNCVNTFDKGHNWYPNSGVLRQHPNLTKLIGRNSEMSQRVCQQKCIELTDFQCMSVFYVGRQRTCRGFSIANETYFKTSRRYLNSMVFVRSCRQIE